MHQGLSGNPDAANLGLSAQLDLPVHQDYSEWRDDLLALLESGGESAAATAIWSLREGSRPADYGDTFASIFEKAPSSPRVTAFILAELATLLETNPAAGRSVLELHLDKIEARLPAALNSVQDRQIGRGVQVFLTVLGDLTPPLADSPALRKILLKNACYLTQSERTNMYQESLTRLLGSYGDRGPRLFVSACADETLPLDLRCRAAMQCDVISPDLHRTAMMALAPEICDSLIPQLVERANPRSAVQYVGILASLGFARHAESAYVNSALSTLEGVLGSTTAPGATLSAQEVNRVGLIVTSLPVDLLSRLDTAQASKLGDQLDRAVEILERNPTDPSMQRLASLSREVGRVCWGVVGEWFSESVGLHQSSIQSAGIAGIDVADLRKSIITLESLERQLGRSGVEGRELRAVVQLFLSEGSTHIGVGAGTDQAALDALADLGLALLRARPDWGRAVLGRLAAEGGRGGARIAVRVCELLPDKAEMAPLRATFQAAALDLELLDPTLAESLRQAV